MELRWGYAIAFLVALGSPAWADDAFAVLREVDRAWTFERVTGPDLGLLGAQGTAARVRCKVAEVKARPTRSRIECATLPADPLATPQPVEGLTLVFGDQEVRQLVDEDPAQLTARANAGPFTFPRTLKGSWRYADARPDGARVEVRVHDERMDVAGAPTTVWIAEWTGHPPRSAGPRDDEPRGVAAFAPGIGPVLRCSIDGTHGAPAYSCLRLVAEPAADPAKPRPRPAPTVAITSKSAQDKSSLSAAAVAAKLNTAYLPGVRRCYAELLKRKPAARGAIELDFIVNAVGKLAEPKAKTADDALATCVRTQMDDWRFPIPQSEYGEPRTARFTITVKLAP
jgi:hypothetical protein